jgi:5-enolpyruvylshikimate-3-phosphate synthase
VKNQQTTIEGVENTPLIARMEEFLTSGNIKCQWSGTTVIVDPSNKKPFEYARQFENYDLFVSAMTLAATVAGSSIGFVADMDETVQMAVLALRRMGAEIEFSGGKKPRMVVKQLVNREIKYHLQRESAKIVPQLVLAMSTLGKPCELFDLFDGSRFDYIFGHFVDGFSRKNLADDQPEDELERRLRKLAPRVSEYCSQVMIAGGVNDIPSTIELRSDAELAAYLVAGMNSYSRGKLILRGVTGDDIADTPLGQLRRMGAEFVPYTEGEVKGYLVKRSSIKGRRVAYEQLHDYPDSVSALALAAALGEGTSVIRSSPYNTAREEARRRRSCDIIRAFGAKIAEIDDGLVVEGRKELAADFVKTANDPFCALLATAAPLGAVDKLEVDDVSSGLTRWGSAFEQLLTAVASAAPQPAT